MRLHQRVQKLEEKQQQRSYEHLPLFVLGATKEGYERDMRVKFPNGVPPGHKIFVLRPFGS